MIRGLSLHARITVWLLAPVVVILVIYAFLAPRQATSEAAAALEQRAGAMAGVLTSHLGDAVGTPDLSVQVGQSFVGGSELVGIYVRDLVGELLASKTKPGFAPQTLPRPGNDQHVTGGDYLHTYAPLLRSDGTVVANLEIVLDRRQLSVVWRQALERALLLIAILLCLVGVMAWFLVRRVSAPLRTTAHRLSAMSLELVRSAREQEASTGQSSTAIEETRRMMEMVVSTAQEISDNCSQVLSNAEHGLSGNRSVSERIAELTTQSERVAELLAGIMKVADRADLLALNAGIEGTRAGEAGKGFALVAAEMRRLAESVVQSVNNINFLISEVRTRADAATTASEAGMRLSEATAESARSIARTTQQQRVATEQVGAAMDEMKQLLQHNLSNIQTTSQSANELVALASRIGALVDPTMGRARDEAV